MHEYRSNDIAIFFDYLQKIPLGRQYEDIRSQVNEASAQLADLSLELNCPVVAISAMDKEGCKLDEKPPSYDEFSTTYFARPTMHNCVGGGDLEYDLDVALILSKDWVATKNLHDRLALKDKAKDVPDLPQIDIINLHVDKNRDSPASSHPRFNSPSSSTSTSSWKSASRRRQNIPKNSRDSPRPRTCSAPFWIQGSSSCKIRVM